VQVIMDHLHRPNLCIDGHQLMAAAIARALL